MTVPSDEALLSFLTSLKASLIPRKVLTNEAFARKLLLGSMQRIGQDSSLRPDDHNASLIISKTMTSDPERKLDVRVIDKVLGVSEKDLLEAVRVTPELGNGSSKAQYQQSLHLSHATVSNAPITGTSNFLLEILRNKNGFERMMIED